MNSKFYSFYFLLIFGGFITVHAQQPNIVLIIADDMGWAQTSAGALNMNNISDFFETPVIKQLSEEGIAFPNGYVNGANCAPTRAAILSGLWASRTANNVFAVDNLNRGGSSTLLIGPDQGIPNGEDELLTTTVTLADAMKSLGYATAHIGKFHVGGSMQGAINGNTPEQQGFDVNYGGGSPGTPGSYFAKNSSGTWKFSNSIGPELDTWAVPYTAAESLELAGDNSLEGTAKHVTDAMVNAAFEFMDANASSPFFIHYSNYAIHGPYGTGQARPDLKAKYEAKNIATPSQMGHTEVGQAAIAEGMDQAIGRLIDYLKTTDDPRNPGQKLSENTLVYFVSDNGGADSPADSIPLREMKGWYYEGGIRALTFVWSEATFLANKGTINTTPVQAFDVFPTFVEMGGGTPSSFNLDGVSQWSMLNGTNSDLGRDALYWHFPGYLKDSKRDQRPVSVIIKDNHKLFYNYETETYEMYDLVNDISESNDLLADINNVNPDDELMAAQLSQDLVDYLDDVSAPLLTYRDGGGTVPKATPIFQQVLDVDSNVVSADDPKIIVSPNPFYDQIEIRIPSIEETRVEIYNTLGQKFLNKIYTDNVITVSEKDVQLSAGTYFLKVTNQKFTIIETLLKK